MLRKWVSASKACAVICAVASLAYPLPSSAALELPKEAPKLKLSEPLPANLFVELGRVVNPAIVNISTSVIPKNNFRRDPMLDFLEQFYGVRPQQRGGSSKPQKMGLGTGFIIREDGLIVTNNHVIANADIVNVQLSEKSSELYEAKVVGSDERTDIALIKITPKEKLPVVVLGSSTDLEVGEWVAAFGNPFGHGHTMTKGIVSSKGRDITEINRLPLIQTDASINPGNSGGPLVNTKGLVVGVNSAIDPRAQGIGFAIPIDEVKKLVPQLESKGRIARAYFGAYLGDLDPGTAAYLGFEDGAVGIASMDPKGPAAKAGLRTRDLILEFNGKEMKSAMQLTDAIADVPIGKKVSVKVWRDRTRKTFDITLTERPEDIAKVSNIAKPSLKKEKGLKAIHNFGFSVSDITNDLRRDYEIDDDSSYPVVTDIEKGSLAIRSGLKVGDQILEINQKPTLTAADVNKSLKKGPNVIRIGRGGSMIILTLDL